MENTYSLVESQFKLVNNLISEELSSDVNRIVDISHHLASAGGKRIRPLVTLLSACAVGKEDNINHIYLATAIEFLHTATLLHDDVVDMSSLRRGKPTANANWGNASSVLVGDFVYSKAFQLLTKINDISVMNILSQITTRIAEGEVKQLMSIGDLNLSREAYFDVITNKTAVLFGGACRCSAVIAKSDKKVEGALANFGLHLGKAFQIFDDYLDYAGNINDLGKNIGDDLAEGKLTLPLIEALRLTSNNKEHHILCNAIKDNNNANIEEVIQIFRDTGALEITLDIAKNEAKNAKEALKDLPDSIYLTALNHIVDQSVSRKK